MAVTCIFVIMIQRKENSRVLWTSRLLIIHQNVKDNGRCFERPGVMRPHSRIRVLMRVTEDRLPHTFGQLETGHL